MLTGGDILGICGFCPVKNDAILPKKFGELEGRASGGVDGWRLFGVVPPLGEGRWGDGSG